jgi:DNA helicase-2/ATP-dependent DNA helicase PcrA
VTAHYILLTMELDPKDLEQASKAQRVAAKDLSPQVRVVAGPGTGKSQTIEQRVAELLRMEIDPSHIAIISFTNASVRDLADRVVKYCTDEKFEGADSLRISTIHSLSLRLLKSAGLLDQFAYPPRVMSKYELKHIHDEEFKLNSKIVESGRRREIQLLMEAVWSTGDRNAPTYTPPKPPITGAEEQAFINYHNPSSRIYCTVVPGEIVKLCVEQMVAGVIVPKDILGLEHLIVDEYQDLSPVDIQFIDLLVASGINTFVAGDDDQSIYSFRHGSPVGIQMFTSKYPNSGEHVLEHCFRCSTDVLQAAQTLIASVGIPDRIAKSQISMYQNSSPSVKGTLNAWVFADSGLEAKSIASSCKMLNQQGLPYSEILILVPKSNTFADVWPKLKSELILNNIPFEGLDRGGIFEEKEGQCFLALLRIINSKNNLNVAEDVVAHRLLLGLRKGIGVTFCNKLREYALEKVGVAYIDLFYEELPDAPKTKALDAVRECCASMVQLDRSATLKEVAVSLVEWVQKIVEGKQIGGLSEFIAQFPPESSLEEVLNFSQCNTDEQRWNAMKRIFGRLELPIPNDAPLATSKVQVMTLHGAKGLSAQVVFIPGLDEGNLPDERQNRSGALLFESARLLFVGLTRARAACVMTTAQFRYRKGKVKTPASRWIANCGGVLDKRSSGLTEEEAGKIYSDIILLNPKLADQ